MTELQGVACHNMGSQTRHKRTHPALTPASEGWHSIYLPWRDGRLSWPPRCPDDAPTRSQIHDRWVGNPTP